MTMTTTTGRAVDAGTLRALQSSYGSLVKAGNDSVRSAWRFGQCIDSFTDAYVLADLADAMGLSVGTLSRYRRLYKAYQRPELAIIVSERLETFNIDLIWAGQAQLGPVEHARPMAGRRYRYTCNHCHSNDVARVEIPADEGADDEPLDELDSSGVPAEYENPAEAE